jgi:hypothetical protein
VTINPVLVVGPVLSTQHLSSPLAVYKLLSRALPAVPNMHFSIVDVRDVAAAHIAAAANPAADGQRFIVSAGGMWFPVLAAILDEEFRPLGFNVPTWRMPSFLVKVWKCESVLYLVHAIQGVISHCGMGHNRPCWSSLIISHTSCLERPSAGYMMMIIRLFMSAIS